MKDYMAEAVAELDREFPATRDAWAVRRDTHRLGALLCMWILTVIFGGSAIGAQLFPTHLGAGVLVILGVLLAGNSVIISRLDALQAEPRNPDECLSTEYLDALAEINADSR